MSINHAVSTPGTLEVVRRFCFCVRMKYVRWVRLLALGEESLDRGFAFGRVAQVDEPVTFDLARGGPATGEASVDGVRHSFG